jgi:hypothetical protein
VHIDGGAAVHPLIGLAILIGAAAFVVFAFRQGQRVRPDGRPDSGNGYGDSGFTGHHDGGAGHG